jgi:hypothetical protein
VCGAMDLFSLLNPADAGGDDLLSRIPPLPIVSCAPQTQLTVIQSAPSKTCPHGLVRYLNPCSKCWEQLQLDAFGWVEDSRYDSVRPEGELCVHQYDRRRCKQCLGAAVCSHGVARQYCKRCDGGKLCALCKTGTMQFWGQICKRCRDTMEGTVSTRKQRIVTWLSDKKKTTLKKISDETYAEADDQKRKARQDAQISKVRASMTEEERAEMDAKRAEIIATAEEEEEAECI